VVVPDKMNLWPGCASTSTTRAEMTWSERWSRRSPNSSGRPRHARPRHWRTPPRRLLPADSRDFSSPEGTSRPSSDQASTTSGCSSAPAGKPGPAHVFRLMIHAHHDAVRTAGRSVDSETTELLLLEPVRSAPARLSVSLRRDCQFSFTSHRV